MEKIWEKSGKVSKEKVAFTISIIQYLLSPKVESIKIDDEAIRKRMKKNIVSINLLNLFVIIRIIRNTNYYFYLQKKLEKGETIEFEEKSDEESESEEESEEKSSEEEKKGKEREEEEERRWEEEERRLGEERGREERQEEEGEWDEEELVEVFRGGPSTS